MEPKKDFFSLFVLSVIFLVCIQEVDCSNTKKSLQSIKSPPLTGAEREKDFWDWVSRVGAKDHSKDLGTAVEMSAITGNVITVGKNGGSTFTTIQAAVNSVPAHNSQRIVIQIAAGVYEEKVNIPNSKPYITFQGAGSGLTTITWHDTASSSGSTEGSASVAINSDYFIARGVTFKNSAPAPPGGAENKQAVALRISGDKASFYNCNFIGAQDTLFDDKGRHYFESCFIQGSIDFICGDGQSLYKGCELRALPISRGSLTAQRRSSPGDTSGFSFVNCKVTGSGMVYLGRAWGPYSRVVFSYTFISDIVFPEGWYNWGVSGREKTVLYGQYKCSGPGANENRRVPWGHELTDAQAAPFQSLSFIDGASWVQS